MGTCCNCGAPCQGTMCRPCELDEHNEEYHGVPEDHFKDDDAEGGGA